MSSNIFALNNYILYRNKYTDGKIKNTYNLSLLSHINSAQTGVAAFFTDRGIRSDLIKRTFDSKAYQLYRISFANGFCFYAANETHLLTQNNKTIKTSELKVGDKLPFVRYSYFGESNDFSEDDGIFIGICCSKYLDDDRYYPLYFTKEETTALSFTENYLKSKNMPYNKRMTSGGHTVLEICKYPSILTNNQLSVSQKYVLYYGIEFRKGFLEGLKMCKNGFYFSRDDGALYIKRAYTYGEIESLIFLVYLGLGKLPSVEILEDEGLLKITEIEHNNTDFYQFDDLITYISVTSVEKVTDLPERYCAIDTPDNLVDSDRLIFANGLMVPYRY